MGFGAGFGVGVELPRFEEAGIAGPGAGAGADEDCAIAGVWSSR